MEYSLSLTFLTETDESKTITINGVKPNLTHEVVDALMDAILTNDIFVSKNGAIVSKKSYTLTERQTTSFDFAV